jgi:hypothetical protein
MNREDIFRMAREAEFKDGEIAFMGDNFIRFAELVAAHTLANIDPSKFMSYREGIKAGAFAEREACAKVCESLWRIDGQFSADEFAAEVRARSKE